MATTIYSSATESKLADDFNKMDAILENNAPVYAMTELQVDSKRIEETWFSAGNAYCKAVLCLLAYQHPPSFATHGLLLLDNSHLKIAASRNYHHFFPKKFVQENFKDKEPNLIANITLIDGYSNKHRIGKKAPSEYITKFSNNNVQLSKTLRSHLIGDITEFGILNDDFDAFIAQRAKAIAEALNAKLLSPSSGQVTVLS